MYATYVFFFDGIDAVFELKVENPEAFGDRPWPNWIQNMVDDRSLIQVYKFSKFMTGVAWLLPEQTKVNPYWLPLLQDNVQLVSYTMQGKGFIPEGSISTEVVVQQMGSKRCCFSAAVTTPVTQMMAHSSVVMNVNTTTRGNNTLITPLLGNSAVVNTSSENIVKPSKITSIDPTFPYHEYEGKHLIIPCKLEPKVLLANERTFMQWIKLALMLTASGATIAGYAQEQERISGITLMLFGVFMMIYAYCVFRVRARKIRNREEGTYDDPFGPVLLVFGLVFMVAVRLAVEVIQEDRIIPTSSTY
jgi:uncharacterized membrane protein YidH (DUF202 family)